MCTHLRLIATLGLISLAACVEASNSVSGIVLDDNGNPVRGAVVSLVARSLSTSTDSAGQYVLTVTGEGNNTVAVTASATGYARQTRVVTVDAARSLSFNLTPADLYVTVNLSGGNASTSTQNGWTVTQTQDSVHVYKTTATGGMGLTIPTGTLRTQNGDTAVGNANLAVTYWVPGSDLSRAPGSMNATFNGQIVPLETFGMTDIQVEQAGALLQVKSGEHLRADFNIMASLQTYLHDVPQDSVIYPSMWYENESTGLWEQQGTALQGNLLVSEDNAVMTMMLPHLSGWNIDTVAGPNGCVSGTAVDYTGQPVNNSNFNLWLLSSKEKLAQYYSAKSDATGSFCVNVQGISDLMGDPSASTEAVYAPSFLSYGDPNNSVCNPLAIGKLSQCDSEPDHCTDSVQANMNNCDLPKVPVSVCHYCPGTTMQACYKAFGVPGTPVAGGCVNIGQLVVPPKECIGVGPTQFQGKACGADPECCSPNGALQCLDGLCVPSHD